MHRRIIPLVAALATTAAFAQPTYEFRSPRPGLVATPAGPATLGALVLPSKTYGDAPFALTAPSSPSSGAFSYTSSNPAVATVSGNMVAIVGAGTSVITATQAATSRYTEGSTSATLTVAGKAPTLSNFPAISKAVNSGTFTLTAPTSNSSGSFVYTSGNHAVATIVGNTVTLKGEGQSVITATQAAAGNYSAGSISMTLTVTSASLAPGFFVKGGKTWSPATLSMTQTQASSYCASATLNGQTGWRLPTISDFNDLRAAGWPSTSPNWPNSFLWTSTGYNAQMAYVSYADRNDWDYKTAYWPVTCVR